MGSITFIDKTEADKLFAMGFTYTTTKSTNNVEMYQFIDTPEIRKIISGNFSNAKFYVGKTVNL